jgi:hypothetical protein
VTEGVFTMWRWIQNQSRGRCEVLSASASDRYSRLAYVGDVRLVMVNVAAHEARFVRTKNLEQEVFGTGVVSQTFWVKLNDKERLSMGDRGQRSDR